MVKKAAKASAGCNVYSGDILERDGAQFEVIVADETYFVIGKRRMGKGAAISTSFRYPEIYSNDPRVMTLAAARFELVHRGAAHNVADAAAAEAEKASGSGAEE